MRPFLMAAALIGGIALAARITSWVNYFTFGQNRERLEKQKQDRSK